MIPPSVPTRKDLERPHQLRGGICSLTGRASYEGDFSFEVPGKRGFAKLLFFGAEVSSWLNASISEEILRDWTLLSRGGWPPGRASASPTLKKNRLLFWTFFNLIWELQPNGFMRGKLWKVRALHNMR